MNGDDHSHSWMWKAYRRIMDKILLAEKLAREKELFRVPKK
jgi:hypothetical protein